MWYKNLRQVNLEKKQRRGIVSVVYKVIEIIGSSEKSWEDAARNAVETAAKSVEEIAV
jgi:hypothetical protein